MCNNMNAKHINTYQYMITWYSQLGIEKNTSENALSTYTSIYSGNK